MSGDGVSLQTNLVQLGNVAKTTARSTQAGHGATPGSEAADRRETAKLHRVNETEKTERQHVDPDRRRERDHRENRPDDPPASAEPEVAGTLTVLEEDEVRAPGVGGLFDRKA
jgi:hypothetical protein